MYVIKLAWWPGQISTTYWTALLVVYVLNNLRHNILSLAVDIVLYGYNVKPGRPT